MGFIENLSLLIAKIILGYMSHLCSMWTLLCQLHKLLYRRGTFLSRWLASYRTPRTNLWGSLWLEKSFVYPYNDNQIFHDYNSSTYNHYYKNDYKNDYNSYNFDFWDSQNNGFRYLNICNWFFYNFYNNSNENDCNRLYRNFSYNKYFFYNEVDFDDFAYNDLNNN